jgi:hypothetical protein
LVAVKTVEYAGIIHQDVQRAVILDCGIDAALRLCNLRNVAAHRYGFAAGALISATTVLR